MALGGSLAKESLPSAQAFARSSMEMLPNLRAGRSVKAITCGETSDKASVSPVNVASAALTTNSHEAASSDPDWGAQDIARVSGKRRSQRNVFMIFVFNKLYKYSSNVLQLVISYLLSRLSSQIPGDIDSSLVRLSGISFCSKATSKGLLMS